MQECLREIPQRENYLWIFLGLKNGAERGSSISFLLDFYTKNIPCTIMLLKTGQFTCCRRQDTKNRHMSSNAIFSRNVYYSLVFVFANNYLTSVALWRNKCFVKVPVLHSSTYHFKPEKHSPEKKRKKTQDD